MKIEAKQASQGVGGHYNGTCPHCLATVAFTPINVNSMRDLVLTSYWLCHRKCPNPLCQGYVLVIVQNGNILETYPSLPTKAKRPELPTAVVSPYREDYTEAANVLSISPKQVRR